MPQFQIQISTNVDSIKPWQKKQTNKQTDKQTNHRTALADRAVCLPKLRTLVYMLPAANRYCNLIGSYHSPDFTITVTIVSFALMFLARFLARNQFKRIFILQESWKQYSNKNINL